MSRKRKQQHTRWWRELNAHKRGAAMLKRAGGGEASLRDLVSEFVRTRRGK